MERWGAMILYRNSTIFPEQSEQKTTLVRWVCYQHLPVRGGRRSQHKKLVFYYCPGREEIVINDLNANVTFVFFLCSCSQVAAAGSIGLLPRQFHEPFRKASFRILFCQGRETGHDFEILLCDVFRKRLTCLQVV